MGVKREIRKLLWKVGYDIAEYTPTSHPNARLKQLFTAYGIDTVLDIGANSGQYAQILRNDVGYTKRIISFEPLSSAFRQLKKKADSDPNWDAFNFALGNTEEQSEVNIAGNSFSSSLRDMLPAHLHAAPESAYLGKEKIEVKKLDQVFDRFCGPANRIYMKIDTQGFENEVLMGGEESLERIDTVQMEMSLVPLYRGELLFNELYSHMAAKGFGLVGILPGFSDRDSGQLLQVDGIFHRFTE